MTDPNFTPAELATIRAEDIVREMVSMSWNEEIDFIAGLLRELDAAKKVADAAVVRDVVDRAFNRLNEKFGFMDPENYDAGNMLGEAAGCSFDALDAAVREYRALTERKDNDG